MPMANRTCIDCEYRQPQDEMKKEERKKGKSGLNQEGFSDLKSLMKEI
jgi:hypothetical protein